MNNPPEFQVVPDKFSAQIFDKTLHFPSDLGRLHGDPRWIDSRYIFIEAQAGQGKTVLTSQLLEERRGEPVCWYRMDNDDAVPELFLSSLLAGLEKTIADFRSPQAAGYLATGAFSRETGQVVLDRIITDLHATVNEPATIVFDDVHLCESSPDSLTFLAHFLNHAPADLKFILASRRNLRPLYNGVAGRERKTFLDNEDLALSALKIAEIFNRFYKIPLTINAINRLERLTSGWMMGLVLARKILEAEADPERIEERLEHLADMHQESLTYFLQQVLATMPARDREILLVLALLDEIPIELAGLMTEIPPAEITKTLSKIYRENGFIRPLDLQESGFVMHHLLQDGLRELARTEKSPRELMALHDRAGSWYFDRGQYRSAVACHVAGGNYQAAQQVFRDVGPTMNLQNRLEYFNRTIAPLADKVISDHPWFAYARGVHLLNVAPPQALPWLERALQGFLRDSDEIGELLCSLQLIYFTITVDAFYRRTYPLLKRSMDLYDENKDRFAPSLKCHAENIFLLANIILLLDRKTADVYLTSGLKRALDMGLVHLAVEAHQARMFRFIFVGDLKLCPKELDCAWKALEDPSVSKFARSTVFLSLLNFLVNSGDFASYRRQKEHYLQSFGTAFLESGAFWPYLFLWDLDMYLAQGDREKFLTTLDKALSLSGPGAGPHFRSQYLLYQSVDLAENGQKEPALRAIAEAGKLRAKIGGKLFQIKEAYAAGAVYCMSGKEDEALESLARAMESDSPYLTASALAWRSACFLRHGKSGEAHDDLRRLLGIMKEKGYRHFYFWTPALMKTLLSEAVRMAIEPAFARSLAAERLGYAVLADGVLLPLLRVTTMGDLKLEFTGLGGVSLSDLTEHQRRLLGMLLSRPDLSCPQEQIQLSLWPDSPEKKSRNNFDTLVARLRKIFQTALGKDLDAKNYLPLRNGILALKHCRTDVPLFREHIAKGLKAFQSGEYRLAEPSLHKAMELWQGEFLAPGGTSTALEQQRINLHLQGLEGAMALAETLDVLKVPEQATELLDRLAPLAPTDPKLARKRYSLYIGRRQPSQAQNVLDNYAVAIREEGFTSAEIKESLDDFLGG